MKQLQRQRNVRINNKLERLPNNQLIRLGLKRKGEVTYPMDDIYAFYLMTETEQKRG